MTKLTIVVTILAIIAFGGFAKEIANFANTVKMSHYAKIERALQDAE